MKAATTVSVALLALGAHAKAAAEAAPEPADKNQLEEILVTATKTEASMRDIPLSMQSFKGDDLVEQGITSLDDILKNAPAVNKTTGQVTIRGVGLTNNITIGAGEETGYFLGEATLTSPSTGGAFPDFDPYDLSTVEVLEGPQSTLFGGTALAGAIRYMPNQPEFDSFQGGVRVGYGTLSHTDGSLKDVSAMLNLPITDSFALRAAGTKREVPNVTDDTFGGRRNTDSKELEQARVMARWQLSDRLSANLVYMRYSADRYTSFLDNPEEYTTRLKRIDEPDHDRVDVGSLTVSYAFDAFSVDGVVNTLENRKTNLVDGAALLGIVEFAGAVPSLFKSKSDVPSYELRVVSRQPSESSWWLFDNWDYLAGLYYMEAEQNAAQAVYFRPDLLQLLTGVPYTGGGDVAEVGARNLVDLWERALYLNLTRGLFDDRLELNLGARFAETRMDAIGQQQQGGIVGQRFGSIEKDTRINPKYALTWHVTEDLNLRASMSEGFRFGGANAAFTIGIEDIPPTFTSDSLRNYELGLRSDWFDRTLRFDVTAYHIDWEDLQISQISPLGANYTDNIGAADIDGVEASLIWRVPADWPLIPAGLTLSAGASYLDARTSEGFQSANGAVAADTRLPLSPRESAVFGLSWNGNWGSWDLSSSVQASYAGSRPNQLMETYRYDAYTTFNASFRIANPTWPAAPAITLSGVNLTDEFILVFASPTTFNPSNYVYQAQSPRTLKLSLDFSFGKN